MAKLQFTIDKQDGQARAGTILLNGVEVRTPVFMPVGTKATIKGLFLEMLRHPEWRGELEPMAIMLANTFHLYLRPGDQLVKDAGGLHKMMGWPGLILTDSGGFQVFSLGLNKNNEQKMSKKGPLVSIREEGIKFRSPVDGSRHEMTPESCVDIQSNLGSDIMMMLDVCSPGGASHATYRKQMERTHRWAKRQFDYYQARKDDIHGVLFPIVQGGTFHDLREISLETLSPYATDGIAVGGVSVGESREQIQDITTFCGERLPRQVPRYLMGIGDPETIRHAIGAGFDMFDCVMPTRLGRHGIAYTHDGPMHMTNARFRNDHTPLDTTLRNGISSRYTKAYIHHLLREKEMMGGIILSLHNIFYLHEMVSDIRNKILTHGS